MCEQPFTISADLGGAHLLYTLLGTLTYSIILYKLIIYCKCENCQLPSNNSSHMNVVE